MTASRDLASNRDILVLGSAYACALVLIRILQLAAIRWFTGGVEFAEDVQIQSHYVADPLQLLLGRATTYDVFPPLFPIVLWSLHAPLSWLPPFFAMRVAMCVVELAAWPLLWWIIVHVAPGRSRHLLAVSYIVAPICWVTTTVMCQDEALSTCFFAAIVVALLHNRTRLAIFLCGVGVVVAKIYLLVPLVGLLGVSTHRTWKTWLQDAFLGFAPIAAVYGLQAVLIGRGAVAFEALDKFVIPFQMSVSTWALFYETIPDDQARRISGLIALALSMLPLLVIRFRGISPTPVQQVQIVVAMLLWVYFAFFHINPEYYLILVPGLFVVFRPVIASLVMVVGFSLPWAVNFFYGVGVGLELGDPGRAAFVRVYQKLISIDPYVMHTISVVLVAAMTLSLAVLLAWQQPARTNQTA